ncbi:hypothetical protein [Singulisphaera sp. PoT]|uniref:hypothetical protein n=1 Tax=Singulisphaera sp. PoT TaxID=3411797 RepID=UPI003BF51CA3
MKAPLAALALAVIASEWQSSVMAQTSPFPGVKPPRASAPAKLDSRVLPATSTTPDLIAPDQIKPATIALPQDAIEPFLLTKEHGPFMVIAKTFRGEDAERFALALVLELQRDYGLPAYILRTKDFPRNSLIRNVPPTAKAVQDRPRLTEPEKTRSIDEAAVLVGNEKTLKAQEALWHKVKKIKPRCLDGMPKIYFWREGLSNALRVTNPYVPAQNLFPGKHDPLVMRMNEGPTSIYHCPGNFSLQVAEFRGRATFETDKTKTFANLDLKKSPLMTAADDAERVAKNLSRDPEVKQAGCQAYVYHDRDSSKVMVGSFNSPNDPSAVQLRQRLLTKAVEMSTPKRVGMMIVPANSLTNLDKIKP